MNRLLLCVFLAFFSLASSSWGAKEDPCAGPRRLQKESKDRKWDISYPVLPKKTSECAVRKWIDKAAADFDLESPSLEETRGKACRFTVTSREKKSAGTFTILLAVECFAGGRKSETTYKTLTFDAKTGEEIRLGDVLDLSQDWHAVLLPFVRGKLMSSEIQGWPDQGAGKDARNFERFALEGKSLVFYFDPGSIAPESEGMMEVRIPLLKLVEILLPPFSPKEQPAED